ncbi:unnamed protein product [Calypogeia fissa]
MCPTTFALLDELYGGLPDSDKGRGLAPYAGQNVDEISMNPSLGVQPPPPLSFRPIPRPEAPPLPKVHPAFDTPADREMMRAIKDANMGPLQAQSVKIQGGVKNGFKVHLNGPTGQDSNASIQGPKSHNYVITPAGAAKGENISINGGGLYIRSANNNKQLITATSCPDNQVQVQVGQGKSAVQLSIQVAPQGKRGEVELNCVRNEAEDGGNGYTVSVNREADADGRSFLKKQSRVAPTERTPSPRCKSPPAHVSQCPASQSHGYELHISHDAFNQHDHPHQDKRYDRGQGFDQEYFEDKKFCNTEKGRIAEKEGPTLQEQYADKLRQILVQKELIQNAEKERMQNEKDLHLANREYDANWL